MSRGIPFAGYLPLFLRGKRIFTMYSVAVQKKQ
jgi:hypothetical protein